MYATQQNADWGLARISNAKAGATTYTYDDSAGEGTCAFVVDTGIDVKHPVSHTFWARIALHHYESINID